ncbi:hypothetical protein K439DRAFT_1508882 [Ramaria rubella]|nr:hypothetical protein K439DRAFT_1508882 [Ramaria rubella]
MDSDLLSTPTPQHLLDELLQYNGWLKTCKIIGEPRWISPPETVMSKEKSSIVIAFTSQEDADELVKRKGVFMFGHHATTRAYIDIPPLRYCTNCWLLDHSLLACKRRPRCHLCAGEHSAEQHECSLCDSIGSACEHTVIKCVHCPESTTPHYPDSYECPY